ncbi:MAG: sodium:solute symporter, partial [Chitinophagaceae bacterium]
STFWMVLLYGFFINLNNFGMDQNYVQRYHTVGSSKEASRSVWFSVWMYVPVSFLFFVIGSCLYAYYQLHPEAIDSIRLQVAREQLGSGVSIADLSAYAAGLRPSDYGDKIVPYFIVTKIPTGLMGIIIAAVLSAAMSTISSGMNASATVFAVDIYKRYFRPALSDKQNLRVLYIGTICFGLMGMGAGIMMIGVKSLLDIWWQLSGIFAGGVLGLFLLGIISRSTRNTEALTATIIGVLIILWLTFSPRLPVEFGVLRNTLHVNMAIVVGTLSIFLVGLLLTAMKRKTADSTDTIST